MARLHFKLLFGVIVLLVIGCLVLVVGGRLWGQERPRRVSEQGKGLIKVGPGSDLQAALNAAECGDTIELQAGATYTVPAKGSFVLPHKPCTGTDADYITIQTSNLAGIAAPNKRLDPATQSRALAKLVSNTGHPVFSTAVGAHHYKFIGLEITTNGDPAKYTPDLVDIGANINKPTRDQVRSIKSFVIDRCFIHTAEISAANLFPSTVERSSGRGVWLQGVDLWVINSYIAGFAGKYPSVDSNAGHNIDSYGIYSPIGPGPLHILNNYIEAQFNNVFTGGSDPDTPNTATVTNPTLTSATLSNVNNLQVGDLVAFSSAASTPKPWEVGKITLISGNNVTFTLLRGQFASASIVPDNNGTARWKGDHVSDVEIRGNMLNKPDAWNAFSDPKAWIELKDCVNCVVDGNDMYSGVGTTIALTVRNQNGSAPWSTIENLSFTNNRMNGFKWGFGIQLTDNEQPSIVGGNIQITNNLIYNQKPVDSNPQFMTIFGGHDVTVQHNTSVQSGAVWFSDRWPITNFVFKDNISQSGRYGPTCFLAPGTPASCWPGVVTSNNVIVDNREDKSRSLSAALAGSNSYPSSVADIGFVDAAKNNYRLSAQSKFKGKGSAGKDPGVDMDALMAALGESGSVVR